MKRDYVKKFQGEKEGVPAKLALIVKEKPDGDKKRRIIIDHKRNGGNSQSTVPERPVLLRIADAVKMMMTLLSIALAAKTSVELIVAGFTDACFHFRIHPDEYCHSTSPDISPESEFLLLWGNLSFGVAAAPLLWSRLWAALG